MNNSSTDNNFEVRAIKIKSKILKEGLGNPNLIAGCTDDEVLHLENKFNISLPESYKVFLKHFGHGLGGLIMNDITIRYQDIHDLTNLIRTEILIYEGDPKLPEKAFVFASRYNEQLVFYDCSKLINDFNIFDYMENSQDFTKLNDSIFDIIESEMKPVRERMIRRANRRK